MVNEEYVMEGRHDLVEMEQVFAHESNDRPMTVSKRQAIWLRQDRDRMIVPEGFTTNKRVWFNGTFGELQKLLKDNIDEISKVEIEDFVEYMPGDLEELTPVACASNYKIPWVLFVKKEHWEMLCRYRKAKGLPEYAHLYSFRGKDIPHYGESPEGLILAIEVVARKLGKNLDLPSFDELANLKDPELEGYKKGQDTMGESFYAVDMLKQIHQGVSTLLERG